VRRRGTLGLVLCGLGAALIALAPLLHWWVGPSLIKSPIGGDTVSDAAGDNLTYLDFQTQEEKTGTVRSRDVYHGIEADSTSSIAVYTLDSEIYASDEPDLATDITASQERFAIDRDSGLAVPDPKGKEQVDRDINNDNAKHSGLILKFPIGTEKKSYPFWDSQIRSSEHLMEYRGEEKIKGVDTYRFEQSIPDTQLPGQQPEVHYISHRIAWVDPATGVIVKGEQQVNITIGSLSETNRLTVLDGTFTFTDENQTRAAERAKDGGSTITTLRVTAPLICLIVGIVVLAGGLVLTLRRQGDTAEQDASRADEPVPSR
jgi:hypothetical protein